MTFATDIALLPLNATQQDARGFLPLVARTSGHLMFVLANCAVDEDHRVLTDAEIIGELTHAREHWNATDANGALSTTASGLVTTFGAALTSAIAEFPTWSHDDRIRNLRDLGNRLAGLMVGLDRELIGATTSDAGFNL